LWLIGSTKSTDFPISGGSVKNDYGYQKAFLIVLDKDGNLFYSTCLGGPDDDKTFHASEGISIQVDSSNGQFCIGGWFYGLTWSSTTTLDIGANQNNAFLSCFSISNVDSKFINLLLRTKSNIHFLAHIELEYISSAVYGAGSQTASLIMDQGIIYTLSSAFDGKQYQTSLIQWNSGMISSYLKN
jgi:hypothetical protein